MAEHIATCTALLTGDEQTDEWAVHYAQIGE